MTRRGPETMLRTSDPDVVAAARSALTAIGAHVIGSREVSTCLRTGPGEWRRFAAHWDRLEPDPYAAAAGTRRWRRYGRFIVYGEGRHHRLPHDAFRQPPGTNRLFPTDERWFAPLTRGFAGDPVLHALLDLLSAVAAGLDGSSPWLAHVHPFRVVAGAGSRGEATPEGRHRDGVTLVSSLLVSRRNAAGGQSCVFDEAGHRLLTTTMTDPGTLLVGDDRRTWHSVCPIRPLDTATDAVRDVLVVTLTAT